MKYWLLKSEPGVFSFENLEKLGKTKWYGVRNYQARNNMKLMKKGDKALFYHSNQGLSIVGVVEITKEAYPEPGFENTWVCVEIKPLQKFKNPVELSFIKIDEILSEMAFVKNSRLSVSPVTEKEYKKIISLSA